MDEEIINLLSFVKSSIYREEIIKYLGKETKMPSEIAKDLKISNTHTSKHLKSLKKRKIIVCLNEDAKRGRLYRNTKIGVELLNYVNNDYNFAKNKKNKQA